MSSGMPELGSKISLISKADIRYEGRLFTVDPQECTIALASVRSFGTEDRETQYPVAPQSQVYDYILFRGSDIKDIRVLNNVPSLPNDPAIMQMSVPPSLGGGGAAPIPPYAGQFSHPVVGQQQYPQYHPMAGFPGSVHSQMNKTSELSSQTSLDHAPQPMAGPIGSGIGHHVNQVKDQGSMLDLIGGGSQQNASRSGTPGLGNRKSPTSDQSTQVGPGTSGQQRDSRRGSNQANQMKPGQQQPQQNRNNSRNRQRYPSGGAPNAQQPVAPPQMHNQQGQYNQHNNQHINNQHNQQHQGNFGRGGGWRGRGRGRGRGFIPRGANKNTLKFDNDYDFEQANTEFEELRNQLAKTKISDAAVPPPKAVEVNEATVLPPGEVDKKDDSGNETGAGEPEAEDDGYTGYDKAKSFFDNISCEAIERSKGRSQRTDWRTERLLNSQTFGVASARRGAWRGRGNWRQYAHHQPWRGMRGNNRGRPNNAPAHSPAGGHQQRPRNPPAPANAAAS